MIYYNAKENLIGYRNGKLIKVEEDNNVFRVLTDAWEHVGDL